MGDDKEKNSVSAANASTKVGFDSKALNGLRGFAAVHIVIHHGFQMSNKLVMYGNVHMPLFFLLSGFCLTLGYGRTKYSRSTVCCGRLACTDACNCCRPCRGSDQESGVFDTHKFLFNRLSRILPVYYICFIIGIALTPTGHNQDPAWPWIDIVQNIESLFLVHVWVFGFFTTNGPSWTISTMFFFYLIFPPSLIMAQKLSNKWLSYLIAILFYGQLVVSCIMTGVIPGGGYWESCCHPVVRWPVFLMGIYAGVLCNRIIHSSDTDALLRLGRFASNPILSFINDCHLPFPFGQSVDPNQAVNIKENKRNWSRRVDMNMTYYLVLMSAFVGLNVYFLQQGSSPRQVVMHLNSTTTNMTVEAIADYMSLWQTFTLPGLPSQIMQFTAVHLQLMVIVGICLDQGGSVTGDFFRTKLLQFLGRISMAVYLVHYPLILWLNFAIHGGPVEWVDAGHGVRINPLGDHYLPGWAIPVHLVLSVITGYLLTMLVEEPAKKFLQTMYRLLSTNNEKNEASRV